MSQCSGQWVKVHVLLYQPLKAMVAVEWGGRQGLAERLLEVNNNGSIDMGMGLSGSYTSKVKCDFGLEQ